MEKEIENLHSIQQFNMDAACFTEVDAKVQAVQPPPSGTDIVVELLETEDVSNKKDDAIKTEN